MPPPVASGHVTKRCRDNDAPQRVETVLFNRLSKKESADRHRRDGKRHPKQNHPNYRLYTRTDNETTTNGTLRTTRGGASDGNGGGKERGIGRLLVDAKLVFFSVSAKK